MLIGQSFPIRLFTTTISTRAAYNDVKIDWVSQYHYHDHGELREFVPIQVYALTHLQKSSFLLTDQRLLTPWPLRPQPT